MINPDLNPQKRRELFDLVLEEIEKYSSSIKDLNATPEFDLAKIRDYIDKIEIGSPLDYNEAVQHVVGGMKEFSVHTPHPRYFGLFNPRPLFPGILADLLTAAFNPQMAAWSHSPFANEVEARLIRELGTTFGFDQGSTDGVFCSGGAEANLTAVLCALDAKYPEYAKQGLMGLENRPVTYCSSEAHHSINKAAKMVGLGYYSVHEVPVSEDQTINIKSLETKIKDDIIKGDSPFLLVGTAGTTGTGAIDNLPALADIAEKYRLWFHVDAAYGGAAIFNKDLRDLLNGIERSASITFDAHKWLSVPMGASVFLTSHSDILSRTFRITTEYMPKDASGMEVIDPYSHSIQWSRRFIGLKLYLSLLFFGWEGYEEIIGHQAMMGNALREKLITNNWSVQNSTRLPVICFNDDKHQSDNGLINFILNKTIKSGKSWISIYPLNGKACLRACITNYNTSFKDIDELVAELNHYREMYEAKK